MSNFFSESGYPDNILPKALNGVQNVNRKQPEPIYSLLAHAGETVIFQN